MIQPTGPGGAGKSTAGAALVTRRAYRFLDLDRELERRNGDIDLLIAEPGYRPEADFFCLRSSLWQ